MKITLLVIGKTQSPELRKLMENYLKRLIHYTHFQLVEIPDAKRTKKQEPQALKGKEAELIRGKLNPGDTVILLDEKGESYTSRGLAKWLQHHQLTATKHLVFIVGGAYGFDESLYKRAQGKLSLSRMTFSHQMIRLFFLEQLYRAFTIIRGEPYHND